MNDRFYIKHLLNFLNVKYEGEFNSRGWLSILCPFHPKPDIHFGNAFINENTIINCFSCGAKSNLYNLIKLNYPDYTPFQIFKILNQSTIYSFKEVIKERINSQICENIKQIYRFNYDRLEKKEVDLNLYYCKTRKFTKDWLDNFEVKIIITGFYKDRFSIPIKYKNKIVGYEFRKSNEFEILSELYNNDDKLTLEELRNEFKKSNIENEYLRLPKVLYNKGNEIKKILFNFDNLDQNEDLYICEGIAGTSDIWNSVSKNVAATFGTELKQEQIKLINKFKKRKIVILDNDIAGEVFLWNLVINVPEIYVFINNKIIYGSEFLLKKSGLTNFSIK